MKLFYKSLAVFIIFLSLNSWALKSNHGLDPTQFNPLDVSKNANHHANMGNIYFNQKQYYSALTEYSTAFNLSPNASGSAAYLYNIAQCNIKLNNYHNALKAIKGAIDRDCINMTYYSALADCYIKLGTDKKIIPKLINDTENPYNRVIVGLIYLKKGKTSNAKAIFDEFINDNPNMIITSDIKAILKEL